MTHLAVSEWGRVPIGTAADAFTPAQAAALIAAAQAHPLGGEEGIGIVSHRLTHLRAAQMVGVLAAEGSSLEILPKVDPDAPEPATEPERKEAARTVRNRLVHMIALAIGLDLGAGETATMARQDASLLDILIRLFADRLLAETRRGLPRAYLAHEEDLPALRGRLDVVRQFTVHAVRPDRLACRYDALSSDIPLLQAMKACVVFLGSHARVPETRRRLDELRFVLADIADVAPRDIPWQRIEIDRTRRRWEALLELAKLFLGRQWQATHHDDARGAGLSLLFPMNDLFERYVAALLPRALAGTGCTTDAQGGHKFCLTDEGPPARQLFQTRPDLIVRDAAGDAAMVIDTKWKRLHPTVDDAKQGVSQGDVYQLMAYGRLYECPDLVLLYPHHAGLGADRFERAFLIRPCHSQRLRFASVDVSLNEQDVVQQLHHLIMSSLPHRARAG
ncbi:McrC family protein [Novosphingobium bradum]|uniref:McrC family protein n=1 Tax=Novosphingobium bradum TaxID=1737444 RepID=A0ABV7IQR7_9SPHN